MGYLYNSIKSIQYAHVITKPVSDFFDNKSLKYMARIGGMTITDQNCIHKEIKSRLNMGNTCYHSLRILCLSDSYSNCKDKNIKKYIVLPIVLRKLGLSPLQKNVY
jgi:hypothetical protein